MRFHLGLMLVPFCLFFVALVESATGTDPQNAAASSSTTLVAELIGQELHINQLNSEGLSLLHIAAREGLFATVEALLDAGADPNIRDARAGRTPLILAASQGNAAIVTRLLQAGAGVDFPTDNFGETALMNVLADDGVTTRILMDAGANIHHEGYFFDSYFGRRATAVARAIQYGRGAALRVMDEAAPNQIRWTPSVYGNRARDIYGYEEIKRTPFYSVRNRILVASNEFRDEWDTAIADADLEAKARCMVEKTERTISAMVSDRESPAWTQLFLFFAWDLRRVKIDLFVIPGMRRLLPIEWSEFRFELVRRNIRAFAQEGPMATVVLDRVCPQWVAADERTLIDMDIISFAMTEEARPLVETDLELWGLQIAQFAPVNNFLTYDPLAETVFNVIRNHLEVRAEVMKLYFAGRLPRDLVGLVFEFVTGYGSVVEEVTRLLPRQLKAEASETSNTSP